MIVAAFTVEAAVRLSGRAGPLVTDPAFRWDDGVSYWNYQANGRFEVYGPTSLETGPYGERLHDGDRRVPARGAGISGDEPEGPLVLAVGDSFTFGQAVASDRTWPAQLERLLAPEFPGLRVLNAGVQGHSLRMIVSHANELAREIQPDLVVVAFIADDLHPRREQKHVDRFGYMARGKGGAAPGTLPVFLRVLARQSHALLLCKQWWEFPGPIASGREPKASWAESGGTSTTPSWIVNLWELRRSLGDTPLVLMNLDLRETAASERIRRELAVWMPEAPLLYLPPYLERLAPSARRVPVDGHPSPAAHQIYAQTALPLIRAHLSGATAPSNAITPKGLATR